MKSIYKKRGFTLLELAVTVIIIAIIAVVALSQYGRAVERSHAVEGQAYLEQVAKAEQFFFLQNGEYTADFTELDIEVTQGEYQWKKFGFCFYYLSV